MVIFENWGYVCIDFVFNCDNLVWRWIRCFMNWKKYIEYVVKMICLMRNECWFKDLLEEFLSY